MRRKTQNEMILEYMLKHKRGITPQQALREAGCLRLGARIWELRHRYLLDITADNVTTKTKTGASATYARYKVNDIKAASKALESMKV